MRCAPARDALGRAQYADLKIWLPGDILTKVDRTSMAVSLEAREPLLDHRLVEFAARLPARLRLRGGTGKYLLKRALGRYLPDEILHRRQMGFVTPIGAWFRGPLAGAAEALGWFDEAAIARVAADHRAGRSDHGRLLWQLMMLDRALGRVFGLGAPVRPAAPRRRARAQSRASTKNRPSGGALKPSAARSRASSAARRSSALHLPRPTSCRQPTIERTWW